MITDGYAHTLVLQAIADASKTATMARSLVPVERAGSRTMAIMGTLFLYDPDTVLELALDELTQRIADTATMVHLYRIPNCYHLPLQNDLPI